MLELNELQSNVSTFNMVTPDGVVCDDVKITVRSEDHPKVKEASRRLSLEAGSYRAAAVKRGRAIDSEPTEEDYEFYEAQGLKRLASYVESINGLALHGKEIGSDPKLILDALGSYGFLAKQVGEGAANTAAFCKQ